MFNFMAAAQRHGVEVIPFSVQNPENYPTEYERYFAKPRADALMYSDTKRTFKNLYGMARAVVWNTDAERRLRQLIRDTKPGAVYILHEVNHLSPSIIRAAKKEGVRVVHRISDFFMLCPKYDLLCGDNICEACIHGDYTKALRRRCVKDSFAATALRVAAMELYKRNGVFEAVDMFIAPSAFTREKLIEGGFPGEKILHIPTFIDSDSIVPSRSHEKYFLFLGRVARQKGTIYAVKAMEKLRDSGFSLKITGSPADIKADVELKRCIEDSGLGDRIVFTGFLSGAALDELIDNAACVMCPSIWYENMPNAVLEAYAHGKPVVASRLGSLTELVEDGETGFLFTPRNHDELAECLMEFVRNDSLSERLGGNARAKCEDEYGESIHMEKVLNCLSGEKLEQTV